MEKERNHVAFSVQRKDVEEVKSVTTNTQGLICRQIRADALSVEEPDIWLQNAPNQRSLGVNKNLQDQKEVGEIAQPNRRHQVLLQVLEQEE
jgi:hypothetical protein